ncbi:hypothetical protein GCM10020001_001360 [Nonomuraea salmonea]
MPGEHQAAAGQADRQGAEVAQDPVPVLAGDGSVAAADVRVVGADADVDVQLAAPEHHLEPGVGRHP